MVKLNQQHIGNQHQAEANQQGIGCRPLISVVVGLWNHFIADDKQHGASGKGEKERQHQGGKGYGIIAHECADDFNNAGGSAAQKGLSGRNTRSQHGGNGYQSFRDVLQGNPAANQKGGLEIPGAKADPGSQPLREIMNGHGGNTPSIDRAALEVYHKGGVCASVDWWSLVAQLDKKFEGGHGDVLETSAMMAIAPESVHLELSKPINAQDPSENMKAAYIQAVNFKGGIVRLVRDTKEIAPSGWFGPFDPKDSSAELGQEALDLAVSYIRDFLEEMKQIELSS